MIQYYYDIVKEVSDNSDLIFCNREEAEVFAKLTDKDSIEDISLAMHKQLKVNKNRIIIITCGCDPVSASSYDSNTGKLDFLIHSYVNKISNDEIVDTNGCGDSFVGGFLSQYTKGVSLEKCLRAV
jgi:adenosine kinase